MTHPVIALLHNVTTNRYHPILFTWRPLPGGNGPDRHKSSGHHTVGFDTREEALANIESELKPTVTQHYGEPVMALEKDFAWDETEEPVPARVTFFSEATINGTCQPMF